MAVGKPQVQPVASLCSTVLGTAIRIPCEVLKQRLQAGMHPSVGAALSHTLKEDGMRGLFRGTTATLLREVPFYVFGMFIYLQVKNVSTPPSSLNPIPPSSFRLRIDRQVKDMTHTLVSISFSRLSLCRRGSKEGGPSPLLQGCRTA